MPELINGNTINLDELSKRNGKSELENMKVIIQLLAMKAEVCDITQKVTMTFPKGG